MCKTRNCLPLFLLICYIKHSYLSRTLNKSLLKSMLSNKYIHLKVVSLISSFLFSTQMKVSQLILMYSFTYNFWNINFTCQCTFQNFTRKRSPRKDSRTYGEGKDFTDEAPRQPETVPHSRPKDNTQETRVLPSRAKGAEDERV